MLAEHRVWCVGHDVARGLVAWANGERDVVLLDTVPLPRRILELQAEGRRCVSLLPDGAGIVPAYGVPRGAPDAGLAFLLHDLCHLEKFVDPAHHAGQKGFFGALLSASGSAAWHVLDARFDEAWRSDVDHIGADMNGACIFLFAALKMKLKMASRRELARRAGRPEPHGGRLDPDESRAFDEALELLLDAFDLSDCERLAARAVSTKRDAREAAELLENYFANAAS
jgi:hypothetical protein